MSIAASEHERKNWDGPQPAIEKLESNADKAVRVTGKDDFVWEPFWLSSNEFLCIIQKDNEDQASIYWMSLDGKNPKLLVKHAGTPSASAPSSLTLSGTVMLSGALQRNAKHEANFKHLWSTSFARI